MDVKILGIAVPQRGEEFVITTRLQGSYAPPHQAVRALCSLVQIRISRSHSGCKPGESTSLSGWLEAH